VKSEPTVYPFETLVRERTTRWDGIRSFEARNNLRAMKAGELLLFYHSNVGKEIVGVAKVAKEAYQDPTTDEDWSCIEIAPVTSLKSPVTLATIKSSKKLSSMALVKK